MLLLYGKILVNGTFNSLSRFNPNGSLDASFAPPTNGTVYGLALQKDGKVLACGVFSTLGTASRSRLAQLTNNDAAQQTLSVNVNGDTLRWQRSGSAPELARVTFEYSTDGLNYTPLGNGAYNNGGWVLSGLSLSAQQNFLVRARGYYATGNNNGSVSIVELVRNPFRSNSARFDFDGDMKADVSLWSPANHNWYIQQSGDNTQRVQLDWGSGALGDIAVPADYDGDGKTDIAVYRPSEGNFYVINSQTNAPTARNWGGGADIPVPADYDGDGRADYAVFRPSEGNWYILNSATNTVTRRNWGASGDKPVAADYDGDGKADIAVFRPSEGNWYIINSLTNTVTLRNWGAGADKVVPADYDGDGRTDLAVFRPAEGNWYIANSAASTVTVKGWGNSTDVPAPADYDGDGQADIAVWRPSEGNWYIIRSAMVTVQLSTLGGSGDVSAPSAFVR